MKMKKMFKAAAVFMVCAFAGCTTTACSFFGDLLGKNPKSVQITGSESFSIAYSLELTATVSPETADQNVKFESVESGTTAAGAAIKNGRLSAVGLGDINIKAIASNGVESAVRTVEAVKEPVQTIINTNAGTESYSAVSVNEYMDSSSFEDSPWAVFDGNYVTGTAKGGSHSVQFNSTSGYLRLKQSVYLNSGDSIKISYYAGKDIYLMGMTDGATVTRVAIDGQENQIDVGTYDLPDNAFSVKFSECSGTYVNSASKPVSLRIYICVLKLGDTTYVDDIVHEITRKRPIIEAGGELELTSIVVPDNATEKEVTYKIIETKTTSIGASIEGNLLTAGGAGLITVTPKADGVYGEEFSIKVV
jgi:hypothetical protein